MLTVCSVFKREFKKASDESFCSVCVWPVLWLQEVLVVEELAELLVALTSAGQVDSAVRLLFSFKILIQFYKGDLCILSNWTNLFNLGNKELKKPSFQ